MFKVVWVAKFHPKLSRQQASRHWTEVHGPMGLEIPGITGYIQNHCIGSLEGIDDIDGAGVTDRRPSFDGYACEWHRDQASFERSLRSVEWKRCVEDGDTLFDRFSPHMSAVVEQRVMRDGPRSPFKIAIFFRFLPELTRSDASEYWLRTHGALAQRVPGIDRYVQNHVIAAIDGAVGVKEGHVGFDGFSECWFRDRETYENARRSPEWVNELTKDGDNVFHRELMRRMSVVVEERTIKDEPIDY